MEPVVQKGGTRKIIPQTTKKLLELSFTHKGDPDKMKDIIEDFFNNSIKEMNDRLRDPVNLLRIPRKNEDHEKTIQEIIENDEISIVELAVALFPIGSGLSPQVVYTRPQIGMIKKNEDLTKKILKVLRYERNKSLYRENYHLYLKAFEPRAGSEEKILRALEVNLAQKLDKTMRGIIMDAYCTAVLEKQKRGKFRFGPMNLFEMRKTFNSITSFDNLKEFHETWLKHTKDASEQTLITDHGQHKAIAELLMENIQKLPLTRPGKKGKSGLEAIPETEVSKFAEEKSVIPVEKAETKPEDFQKGADAQKITRDAQGEAKADPEDSQEGADAQKITRDAQGEAKADSKDYQ